MNSVFDQTSVLPALAMAAGIVGLSQRPVMSAWLGLCIGIGVAVWAAIWFYLSTNFMLAAIGWTSTWLACLQGGARVFALNAGFALAAWLPVAGLTLACRGRFRRTGESTALFGLPAAGLVMLPMLGQGGQWPPESIALAALSLLLSLLFAQLCAGTSN